MPKIQYLLRKSVDSSEQLVVTMRRTQAGLSFLGRLDATAQQLKVQMREGVRGWMRVVEGARGRGRVDEGREFDVLVLTSMNELHVAAFLLLTI